MGGGNNDVDLLQPSSKHTPLAAAISSTLQRSSPTSTVTGNGIGMVTGSGSKPRSAGSNCSSSGGNGGVPPPIPERTNLVSASQRSPSPGLNSPVWLSRHLDGGAGKELLESGSDNHSKNHSADEEDVDTDLETDRLLGHQRLDDQGYYDENKSWDRKPRSLLSKISPKQQIPSTKTRNGYNALLSSTPELPPPIPPKGQSGLGLGLTLGSGNGGKLLDLVGGMVQRSLSRSSSEHSDKSPSKLAMPISGGDLCAAGSVDVVASAVAAASAAVVSTPALGSPGNGGGSERSAGGGLTQPGGAVKIVGETENGALNGGTLAAPPLAGSAAGSGGGSGTGSGTGSGSGAVANGTAVANSNSNNNNGSGSNNNSSGSNSNSGEKKVKKSKSKEGKCVGFILRSIVPMYNHLTI